MLSRQTKLSGAIACVLSMAFMSSANADNNEHPLLSKEAQAKFSALVPLELRAVEESPIPGLLRLVTERGVFYMTDDAEYIVAGNIHEAKPGLPNLTRQRAMRDTIAKIDDMRDGFITYEAPNSQHEVIVFYDTSCPWCVRQHNALQDYLDAGITVHYAAFPRQGIRSRNGTYTSTYNQMQNVWCADSPQSALDISAQNGAVPVATCDNGIEAQFELGKALGVTGTPATIDMQGNMVATGFAPAAEMLRTLSGGS